MTSENQKPYELSVQSDTNFDRLIVEVKFEGRVGLVFSQEASLDRTEVTLYSLFENSKEKFFGSEKIESAFVALDDLEMAIQEAKMRLRALDGR